MCVYSLDACSCGCCWSVFAGSTARMSEVRVGDEIVTINGQETEGHYSGTVEYMMNAARKSGRLEMTIKRGISCK